MRLGRHATSAPGPTSGPPFVDVDSGKKYKPVAWHVSGEGFAVDELKKGEPKKHAVECSYSDGEATGTVTVKKA